MKVKQREADGVVILDVAGELHEGPETPRLRVIAKQLADEGKLRLLLNFSKVSWVASTGHASSASPHSVTTVSASRHGTSLTWRDGWEAMSMPSSAMTSTAVAWTCDGSVPALHTSASAGLSARAKPSAIWLRAELWTHRNNTRRGGAVMKAAGRPESVTGSPLGPTFDGPIPRDRPGTGSKRHVRG